MNRQAWQRERQLRDSAVPLDRRGGGRQPE